VSNVVFEDPPRPLGRGIDWYATLEPLVARPGEWARVRTFSSSGGATNAMARLRDREVEIPAPEGDWEFTTRAADNGRRHLYARFHRQKGRVKKK
jgi:hypothetical protein